MSMYSYVKTSVFSDGEKSIQFDSVLGVRQGECVSPFLFAIYINYLEENIADTESGVCFDDPKILSLFYADNVFV